MAGSSPPNIPDTLNILYFGTLLAAILWASRHDIRTAVVSLAALTVMGLVIPFLGSPDPVFVHVVYLAVATFAFCMSDSNNTNPAAVDPPVSICRGLVLVGTALASICKALAVWPIMLLGGLLGFPAVILRVILGSVVYFVGSVVALIQCVLSIGGSTFYLAVCALRVVTAPLQGVIKSAAFLCRFVCLGVKHLWAATSKCIWITTTTIKCVWAILAVPVTAVKALVTGFVTLFRVLCFLAVTISAIVRGTIVAASLVNTSLRAAIYVSVVVGTLAAAVSKCVARKCITVIYKPTEPQPARVVRIVSCPKGYVFRAPRTDAPVTSPLLRHFHTGVLFALVILHVVRDVLPETLNIAANCVSILAAVPPYLSADLALSIGVSLVGYYTVAPIALAVADFVRCNFQVSDCLLAVLQHYSLTSAIEHVLRSWLCRG